MASLAHNTANDTRFNDVVKTISALARDEANGVDAKPKVAQYLVRAAADGVFDLAPDADGKFVWHDLYGRYVEAFGKKVLFDNTKDGLKKGASEFKQLITFGAVRRDGAVDVLNRAASIHASIDKKDRKSAFPAFVDVARAQIKSPDADLTDGELETIVRKAEGKDKVQADFLKSAAKALEKAQEASDADPAIAEEIAALTDKLGALIAFLGNREAEAAERAKLAELMAKYQVAA